jgi:hypothetical protein
MAEVERFVIRSIVRCAKDSSGGQWCWIVGLSKFDAAFAAHSWPVNVQSQPE